MDISFLLEDVTSHTDAWKITAMMEMFIYTKDGMTVT